MTPKAADRARGWPARLADVTGMRVRLNRAVETGAMVIPAGTEGVLRSHGNGWHLLHFEADACTCCGVKPRASRMSWTDFDVVKGTAAA